MRGYFRTTEGADFVPDRAYQIGGNLGHDMLWEANAIVSVEATWNPARVTIARYDERTGNADVSASLGSDLGSGSAWPQFRLIRLGDSYWIAWTGDELHLAQVADDLSLVDPPSWLHTSAMTRALGLESHPNGDALLAWTADSSMVVLPFDGKGAPAAPRPIVIGPAEHVTRIDVAPWQDGWLVAWQEPWEAVRWVRLNRDGSPGTVNTLPIHTDAGLAVTTHEDVALIAWRSWDATRCYLIRSQGRAERWLGPSVFGSPESETEQHLDAWWDGHAFVVAWSDWHEPPTVRDGCDYSELFAELAVRAAWISDSGQVRGQPAILNRVHRTREAWPHAVGNRIHVVLRNEHSSSFQQVFVDHETRAVSPVSERIVIRDVDWCEYDMGESIARESTAGDLVTAFLFEYDYGNWLEVQGVTSAGEWWESKSANTSQPLDIAATSRSVWVAQRAQRGHEGIEISVRKVGGLPTSWYVGSSRAGDPSLGIVGEESAIALWVERPVEGPSELWSTIIHPVTPPGTVPGARLFPELAAGVARTHVVRGPGGSLAVLSIPPAADPSRTSLYVARLNADGAPLDAAPVPLSDEAQIADFEGVWDGTTYFVAWSESGERSRLMARRVHPRRGVIDSAPGLLLPGASSGIHVAANPRSGLIALTYDRDRLVTITADPVPVVLTDLRAERTSVGVEISWNLHLADEFAFFDVERLRVDQPALRLNAEPLLPRAGSMSLLDSAFVPAGTRYVVRGITRNGDVYTYGPVSVDSTPAISLDLVVHPNPARGALNVEFSLPYVVPATLELFDSAGRRMIYERLHTSAPGRNVVSWPTNKELGAGAYWVRLTAGRESHVASLRIVR